MSECAARPLRDEGDDASERLPRDARGLLSLVPSLRQVRPESHAGRRARLLIVDDNPDSREIYALYLRTRGYDVFTAHNGPIAIEMATKLKPDVVVMDLAMPGMSGISAAHHLKNDPRTRHVAVILLTGHYARAIEEGALEMGVDVFLTKPCLPDDLESHVKRLMQQRRRTS